MRWKPLSASLLGLAICGPLPGCGSDREERGLAASEEEAVPMDAAEDGLSEEERREQEEREEAAREQQDFDAGQEAAGDGE